MRKEAILGVSVVIVRVAWALLPQPRRTGITSVFTSSELIPARSQKMSHEFEITCKRPLRWGDRAIGYCRVMIPRVVTARPTAAWIWHALIEVLLWGREWAMTKACPFSSWHLQFAAEHRNKGWADQPHQQPVKWSCSSAHWETPVGRAELCNPKLECEHLTRRCLSNALHLLQGKMLLWDLEPLVLAGILQPIQEQPCGCFLRNDTYKDWRSSLEVRTTRIGLDQEKGLVRWWLHAKLLSASNRGENDYWSNQSINLSRRYLSRG